MKTGLWLIVGFAIAFWSVAGLLAVQMMQWLLDVLPQWAGAIPPLAQWPEPTWLALWVDPALVQSLLAWVGWLIEVLRVLMPSPDILAAVLTVLLGLLWGAGLLVLLGLGLVGHFLIRRRQRRRLEPV